MGSSKISEDTTTDLTTTGFIPLVRSGTNYKISSDMMDLRYKNIINIKEPPFNAACDDITDDSNAIQNAINFANGQIPVLIPGKCRATKVITLLPSTSLIGFDPLISKITWNHTGDGITMTSPINSSTAVHSEIKEIGFFNTNSLNTGGGYVDVGGTFVRLTGCRFGGFKYGIIFDQTELATIDTCDFEAQLSGGGGVWLVNGTDHAGGALYYTNRILIRACQFDQNPDVYGIIDDGGTVHSIENNNFNGCTTAIRASAVSDLEIRSNEIEGTTNVAASHSIILTNTRLSGVGGVISQCGPAFIWNNFIISPAGKACIQALSNCEPLVLGLNKFSSDTDMIVGSNLLGTCLDIMNVTTGGGAYFINTPPTRYSKWDASDGSFSTNIFKLGGTSVGQWVSGTVAPSSGAHVAGEIVWQSAPSSGGFIGFVCVTGGTPGTWKTFGVIS